MKKILIFIIISISFNSYSQELKKKKKSNSFSKEIYYIDKKDKTKNGPYLKLKFSNKDTLILGEYLRDKKSGIWTYYSNHNNVFLKYNFDSKQIVFKSDKINKIDSFFIKIDNDFLLSSVDSPPIYIGYENEIRYNLARNISIPMNIRQKGVIGISIIVIEINKMGKMTNISIDQSVEKSLDNDIVETIEKHKDGWIPAYRNGKPVASKIFIAVTVQQGNPKSLNKKFNLENKPYFWLIDLFYFSVTR